MTPSSEAPDRFLGLAPEGNQHDLENLSRFLEFSRVFAGGFDLSAVLDRVVDVAMEITEAERGSLILVRPGDHLEFRIIRKRGHGAVPREGYRVSETIVREVVSSRKPRVVSDITHDAGLSTAQSVVSLQLGSAAAIPLWRYSLARSGKTQSTDKVFGVLYLDSRARRDAFSRFDIGMLETLARDASSAIENARLLRETEEKHRMARELETAREVQAALLPESYWSEPHFEVAGSCVPCLDLAGDFLEQFRLPDGRVGFVVADVCGKGVAAALLAATLQGALTAEIASDHPLVTVVERLNRVVCRLAPLGDFISILCCVLSPDGSLTYVNAGHCPLITAFADDVQAQTTRGRALGIDAASRYTAATIQLRPGEVAFLYTDGVVEAASPDGELFGEQRLATALSGANERNVTHTMDRIQTAVDEFRGNQPVADDITLMAVRYVGGAGAPTGTPNR